MAEEMVMATDDLMTEIIKHDQIRHTVRQQYGQIAEKGSCGCGGGGCHGSVGILVVLAAAVNAGVLLSPAPAVCGIFKEKYYGLT